MVKSPRIELIEIERKRQVLEPVNDLLKRLVENNFDKVSSEREIDTYYSRPDVDYMKTVECLRIRERGEYAEITYKPASSSLTTSAEGIISKIETNVAIKKVSDVPLAKRLLTNIGMVRLVEVNKFRQIFKSDTYSNLIVSIDEIKGAGTYVEVEAMSTDKVRAQAIIAETEAKLAIHGYPIVAKPYRDICMEKGL